MGSSLRIMQKIENILYGYFLWLFKVLKGGSSCTWVNTVQLKTLKMMACPTDSVHVDTAYPVFQRRWNMIFSPWDITFLILQEIYFRGT